MGNKSATDKISLRNKKRLNRFRLKAIVSQVIQIYQN